MLDHFIKAMKLPPRFSVRIKTRDPCSDVTAEKEMVEQHHGIRFTAKQRVEEFFLRISFPSKLFVIDAVNAPQQILMDRVQPLMGRDYPTFEILRRFDRTVGAHENTIPLHRRLPFRRQPDDRRPLQLAAEKIRQIKICRLHIAADQCLLLLLAGRIRQLDDFHINAVRLNFADR